MRIKKATFAIAAILLAAMAVVVLWRYHVGVPLKVPDTTLGGLVAFGNINAVRNWSKEDLRSLEVVAELLVDQIAKSNMGGGEPA